MPIATVIVDDEKLAREELHFLLKAFPDVEVVATGQNGLEAVKLVKQHHPDLLFLDAQMPGLDGFGTVRMLAAKHIAIPYLVFATAHDQYALEAFNVNAVDYLLKPFDALRLAQTIEKIKRHIIAGESVAGKIDRVLQMLDERMAERKSPAPTRIMIKVGGRQLLLDPQEVVFARVESGVITIATRQIEGQATCRTIEELQAALDGTDFFRAHRAYLVNLKHVREIVPWFNSSFQLRMDDKKQTEVPVSRTQSRQLRELYKL
ncbi:MAG TPA: LytTR family DNA-binding domain-containing protein [Terriglobales bacterium]|nr:LytTR family DNA-binding domain-containing protein [Terriglobales bacterium]